MSGPVQDRPRGRRRKQVQLPTRQEQRTIDNVRPRGDLNPELCNMRGRSPLFDRQHNCAICGFQVWGDNTHCHLLETCDRCYDEVNPCDTGRQISQSARRVPY